ncbi:MAG: hypothetical protein NVV59_14185 [Chitinophagaceae bacterium]|nr:hypothetical protein [Chitinophagaceae bacterium]
MFGEIGAGSLKHSAEYIPILNHRDLNISTCGLFLLKVFPDFSVSYKSTYGTIESSWQREGKEIAYRAVVPDNSRSHTCNRNTKREVTF